jgi:putative NADH-flavin reductase
MATLYELSEGYAQMMAMYEQAETEAERADLLDLLAGAEGDITEKAEAYARIMKNKQAEAEGFKAEAERLTAKRKAAEAVVERMKEAITTAMMLVGAQEIGTTIGKWRLQENPWSCEVVDVDAVPEEWHIKVEDKIDKRGLVKHFQMTGEMMPGVEFHRSTGARFR